MAEEHVEDLLTTVDNETLWALTDHLGSVRDMIDSEGTQRLHRRFDSFGNILDETYYDAGGEELEPGWFGYATLAFGFTGRPLDETTGLQNNLHRWYDASVGRWLSEDPIGFDAGDANLYRYVGNEPTGWIDPSGFAESDPWGQIIDPGSGMAPGPGDLLPALDHQGPFSHYLHYVNPFVDHHAVDSIDACLQWGTRIGQGAAVAGSVGAGIAVGTGTGGALVEGIVGGTGLGSGGIIQIRPPGGCPWFRIDWHRIPIVGGRPGQGIPFRGPPLPHVDIPPAGIHHFPWFPPIWFP